MVLSGTTTFVLHKVAVASRRAVAARLAERPGLTLWEFAALAELPDQGAVAQHVLATGLGVDTSDMVRLMDDLIDKGLVARDRDPVDRRRYRIDLTTKGRRALKTARVVIEEVEQTTLQPLTATERARLLELVAKVQSVNN